MSPKTHADLVIRKHNEADIETLFVMRYVAVHELAGDVYDKSVLEGWTGKLDEIALQEFRANIDREVRMVVELDRKPIGFGWFHVNASENCADIFGMYVLPGYGRQGVGGRLLMALENEAEKLGLGKVWVTSPLNAIRFFEGSGYEFVTDTNFKLYTGQTVPCARLVKALD